MKNEDQEILVKYVFEVRQSTMQISVCHAEYKNLLTWKFTWICTT